MILNQLIENEIFIVKNNIKKVIVVNYERKREYFNYKL